MADDERGNVLAQENLSMDGSEGAFVVGVSARSAPAKETIDGGKRDARGTIASSSMFAPVSTATTAADEVAQTLQTLSVATTTSIGTPSSAMSSVEHSTGRRDVVTPPVGLTGTPELSPSLLSSLRGSSSPSHSQVSVGSIGHVLTTAALSQHKYDLTPVTRNTSDIYCDVNSKNIDSVMTITPSSQEGYLHGEHLAFPSDLSGTVDGPAMPPLQPVHRSNSSSMMTGEPLSQIQISHRDVEIPGEPVQFPSRKYYSFTTRKQYEEACLQDADGSDDDLFNPSDSDDEGYKVGLTPYAPRSRPANFDIESLPEEELKRIFITRDNVRLAEIPLDQRVPSLHMANHLHGSTTSISYTDHEDEDSIVHLRDNDDASLSSRGSSLYLPAEDDNATTEEDDAIIAALQRKQRKRKQRKKEQQAVEWLQSVEADQNVLAEAASSKFLTTGLQQQVQQQQQRGQPQAFLRRQSSPAVSLQRQISSPATLAVRPSAPPQKS